MSFNENDSGEQCDRWSENDEAVLNLVLQWSLEDSSQQGLEQADEGTSDHRLEECEQAQWAQPSEHERKILQWSFEDSPQPDDNDQVLEECREAQPSQQEPQEDTHCEDINSKFENSTNETEDEHMVDNAPEEISSALINNDSQTSEPDPTLCTYQPDNVEPSGVWDENAEALTSMVLQWSLEDSSQHGTADHCALEECGRAQPSQQEPQEDTLGEDVNSNFEHSTNNTEDEHTVDCVPEKMSTILVKSGTQINEPGPTLCSYQPNCESESNEDTELMLRAGSNFQIYDEGDEWFKVAMAMSLQEQSLPRVNDLADSTVPESTLNPDSTSQLSDQCHVNFEPYQSQDLNFITSNKNKILHHATTSKNVHFRETDQTHKFSHDTCKASAGVMKKHKYQSVIDATVPELENLKTLLNLYYDHPCKKCGGESNKVEVGSWACGDCNIVWGYDDLNGITDFVKDLIKLEPCRNCRNDDPYKIGLIMLDEKPIYGCNVCNHEMRPPKNPHHPPQNVHSKQYGSELAPYGSYDELRNNGAVDVYSGFQNNRNDQEMVDEAEKINGFAEAKEELDKLKPALMASTGRCIKDLQRTLARNNNTSNLKTQLSTVGRREAAMLLPQIGQNLGAAAGWLLFKNPAAANIGGTVGGIIGEVISGLISRR